MRGQPRRLILLAVCISSSVGCRTRERPPRPVSLHRDSIDTNHVVSVQISEFLHAHHFVLDTVLADHDSVFTLVAKKDTSVELVTLRRIGGKLVIAGRPTTLGPYGLPSVRFARLADATLVRVTTFDDLAEGIIGTEIAAIHDSTVRRLFADGTNACRPADAVYSDRSTLTGIVAYYEYPFGEDCMHSCAFEMRNRLGLEPAWTELLIWDGMGFQQSKKASSFYQRAAKKYRDAAIAIDRKKLPTCAPDAARLQRLLTAWAQRAEARSIRT